MSYHFSQQNDATHLPKNIEKERKFVVQKLVDLFSSTEEEIAEFFEFGFSIKSSIKDLQRLYIKISLRDFLLDKGLNIEEILNLYLSRIDKFSLQNKILESDQNNLNGEILEFLTYLLSGHNLYERDYLKYEVKDYFTRQFLTQIGEKSGQRVFRFEVGQQSAVSLIESGLRAYNLKKCEREKIELLNMAQIYWDFLPNQTQLILLNLFPELNSMILNEVTLGKLVRNNYSLVEISPPIYSHQTDVMLKFINFNKERNCYEFEQLSLPQNGLEQILQILNIEENIVSSYSSDQVTHPANEILSKIFAVNSSKIKPLKHIIINSCFEDQFEDIKDFYGQDELVSLRVGTVLQTINPFIDKMVDEYIPNTISNTLDITSVVKEYKNILLLTTATVNPSTIITNDKSVVDEIQSGKALRDFVINGSISISSVEIAAPGDCDNLTGTLTGKSYKKEEKRVVNLNPRDANNPIWMVNGKFNCPVCKAVTLDICQSCCPNCRVSLNEMRKAVENNNLSTLIKLERDKRSKRNIQSEEQNLSFWEIILKIFIPFL